MKKEGLATSRATSANFSITEIEIRSNLGSIELEEYSNKIENLSVSVISSNETLIRSSAQTNKTVRPQCDNHNEKEKEKLSKDWIVPGFGFIAVMVLLIGIIFGFLGAFRGIFLRKSKKTGLYKIIFL